MTHQRPDLQSLYDSLAVVINAWPELFPDDTITVAKLLARRRILEAMHYDATDTALAENIPLRDLQLPLTDEVPFP